MPENTEMAEPKPSKKNLKDEGSVEKKKKKKKTRSKEKKTWAEEGQPDPFEVLDALPESKQQEIQRALHLFSLGQAPPRSLAEARRHTYRFWNTQPVPKIGEEVKDHGPILEQEKCVAREEPFSLPEGFSWATLDIQNPAQLEELCLLLNANYIEEDDNTMRFVFSPQFLLWALCPPGWQCQWHCGVRVNSNQKLVGFISAIPSTIQTYDTELPMVEVNFLCVHKKLRSKRVAPVLCREISRRVMQHRIVQAVYSASNVLPSPTATCRYWHRSLNPRKLIEVNFSSLGWNMTVQRALKLNRLPEAPKTPGLRPMRAEDGPAVQTLLEEYLKRFQLRPKFSEQEVLHWLLPREEVIDTYVVESPEGVLTDLLSFYTLTSAVLNHPVHRSLKAAFCFYYAHTATPLPRLMEDVLHLAKARGFDVFTALNVMENGSVLEQLKFSPAEGHKHYYLYNWRCPTLAADKVGLVLK
ncbi:glycylpeptide N-tetradecanoyltransferase 1b [Clupea harengus]|uniref:Glycylpeptide N-tetradecanoyltransferase n=1 Tax=Clupea harengus TaxID=7950 RepID=A0A6P8EZF6_CLUHA|nr:glycylpeptide N-tetradecanoyltransferase 1b [Clupea harengus]